MEQRYIKTGICEKIFPNHTQNDLFISVIGYNDFTKIKPWTRYRFQPCYTLHYIVSGKGYLEIGDKIYKAKSSDIIILPPHERIRLYPDSSDPYEYIYINFDGNKASDYIRHLGFSLFEPIRHCTNTKKMLMLFSMFFEKAMNEIPISTLEATALFLFLLDSALTKDSKLLAQKNEDLVEEAKIQIQQRFKDPSLTVESIANNLNVSHSLLCRLFKKKTGDTMISYINDCRMEHAERLLKTSALSSVQISYISGFSEYNYFLLQFKKRYGMTTSEYRNFNK